MNHATDLKNEPGRPPLGRPDSPRVPTRLAPLTVLRGDPRDRFNLVHDIPHLEGLAEEVVKA